MAKRKKGSRKKKLKQTSRAVFSMDKRDLAPLLTALAITAICFLRVSGYDFVNWDDDFNISKNPNLRYFDWTNVKGIFTSHVIGNYNPLPILTFALEKHFFGLDPGVYHTTNLLLHLVCVFLVYRFLRLIDMPVWAAAIAAGIFGIHPMRIESVAWVTERKDVLFGAFYLGAMIQYVKYIKSKQKQKYLVFAVLLFVLSLFSKIQAVALPLTLLGIDYLLGRKLNFALLWKKWYFFLLSLAFGLIGIYFLRQQGSLDTTSVYNLGERLLIGVYSYVIYIVKFLVPFRISPLYPYPPQLPFMAYITPVALAAIAFAGYTGFRRQWKPFVFGLYFFTVNIAFVLQVVGAGQGFLADRFTYIPYLGLIYPFVHYAWQLMRNTQRTKVGVGVVLGLWTAAMLVQTWRHVPLWENSGTLWTHVLKYYKSTPLPYRNRAQYYRDNNQLDKAIEDYNRSIALKKDPDVINSRARLYFDNQVWDKALIDYNLAIELNPEVAEYWINRGAVHAMQGNWQPAMTDMTEGIRLDPQFANGYKNRSLVYQRLGQVGKAQEDLERYLELNPYDADIWYESGRLHRMQRQPQRALTAFNRAIELNPNQGLFWLERARTYHSLGNIQSARNDLRQAESLGAEIDAATRSAING